jgi:hypothetical protein
MNERVSDDFLSKLDTDFDVLADTTMRVISAGLTSQSINPETNADQTGSSHLPLSFGQPQPTAAWMAHGDPAESWDDMGHFLDILGMNNSETYWDMFPQDVSVNDGTLPWEIGL